MATVKPPMNTINSVANAAVSPAVKADFFDVLAEAGSKLGDTEAVGDSDSAAELERDVDDVNDSVGESDPVREMLGVREGVRLRDGVLEGV
jgi:hypothetical protein